MKADENFRVVFGDNIRKIREKRDLTQSELAVKINVSVSSISDYERGTKCPSVAVVKQIADELDVSMDELCQDSELPMTRGIVSDPPAALSSIIALFRLKIESVQNNLITISIPDPDPAKYFQQDVIRFFAELKEIQDLTTKEENAIKLLHNALHEKFKHIPGLPTYTPDFVTNKEDK
ncbi:MAG: helix-turn-helix transcriptional regulator [Ruminococcus sp.]|nr:helix-turn-helix transcriptional regulator [Ruminococcus sp.]